MAFKKMGWNPMDDAYRNANFNKYEEGPGGELSDDLQPGALAANGRMKTVVSVHLKNVPDMLDKKGLINLCREYGQIVDVVRFATSAIVNCLNLNEAENIMRSINQSPTLRITASFAVEKQQNTSFKNVSNHNNNSDDHYFKSEVNMQNRRIKGPFSKPSQITLPQKEPLLTKDDYSNSKLRQNDPNMDYCGIVNQSFPINHVMNKNNVTNGRANYRESVEFLNQMKNLSLNSNGFYDPDKNEYTFQSSELQLPPEGSCKNCGKKTNINCQRCGEFYCSVKCQTEDWPTHRPICFPMPRLVRQKTPSSCVSRDPLFGGNSVLNGDDKGNETNLKKSPTVEHDNYNNGRGSTVKDCKSKLSDRLTRHANQDAPKSISNILQENRKSQEQYNNDHQQQEKPQKQVEQQQQQQQQKLHHYHQQEQFQKQVQQQKPQRSRRKSEKSDTSFGSNGSNKKQQIKSNTSPMAKSPECVPDKRVVIELTPPPEKNTNVNVTAVIDHRTFYIRSLQKDANDTFLKNLNDIAEYSVNAKLLTKLPQKGDIVLAEFEGDYYRALIIKVVDADNINVAFVDFGNAELKKLDDLKELSVELQTRKRFTFKVVLQNVPITMSNDKVMTYLHNLVETCVPLKLTYDGAFKYDNKTLDLIDSQNQQSLNKYLSDLNAVPVAKLNDEIIYYDDIEKSTIEGENIEVVVLHNSFLCLGMISCVLLSDLNQLSMNDSRFQDYCEKSNEPYTPRTNELCLVKYDEDQVWYRGICQEVVGDGHPSIMFLDYGNLDTIKIENIRKMPKEFAFPSLTVSCFISGIPNEPSAELVERLQKLLPINDKIKVKKSEKIDGDKDNSCLFYLPEVEALLTE